MTAVNGSPSAAPVALDVKDIHKSYGAHEVLKGISLTAHEHDVVAILGLLGVGQVHLPALHQPARDAEQRRGAGQGRADPHGQRATARRRPPT